MVLRSNPAFTMPLFAAPLGARHRLYSSFLGNLLTAIDANTATTSQEAIAFLLDPGTGLGIPAVEFDAAYKAWGNVQ